MKADTALETPIYRLYLAGGPESLHLPWAGASVVFGLGLIAGFSGLVGAAPSRAAMAEVPLAAAGALIVAAFAARWFGARRGLLAGIGIATSMWTFTVCGSGPLGRLSDVLLWGGLSAFALANVPGRLQPVDRPWVRVLFWASLGAALVFTGAVGPCYMFTVCGLYLLAAQDRKGVRFLFDWRGLASFAAVMACLATAQYFGWRPAQASALENPAGGLEGQSPVGLIASLAVAGLPWMPLAVPGLVLVLRQGYYFAPLWRFLACWTLVPTGLLAAGLFRATAHLPALLPPLAVLAAVGFDDGLHRLRRLGWLKRRSVRATA